MSTPYTLIVGDNVRRPKGTPAPSGIQGGAGYEPEHSERQVTGSVAVGQASRWVATLAVPMTGDQSALLTFEREGPLPAGAPAVEQVMLVIPPGEADAVLMLLQGIVAHARRNGVMVGRKEADEHLGRRGTRGNRIRSAAPATPGEEPLQQS